MGFVRRFFERSDPALEWRREGCPALECDVSVPSFCGVKFGDPIDALRKLGAPANARPTRDGQFGFPADGFEIDATDGRVDCFLLLWNSPDRPAYRTFTGRLLQDGKALNVQDFLRKPDFVARFGPPYWEDEDPEEALLFYEFGSVEWQVEFLPSGILKAWNLRTPPLLSDPAQREAYRVTRPWPAA